MEGLILCALALIACFMATRRSLAIGLGALMAVGYAYGIVRANLPQTATHFLFDFGVGGFYLALSSLRLSPEQSARVKKLQPWLAMLAGWPILLFFFPIQDPLIQLVGLRGQIYFLPFIAIGAMLDLEGYYVLGQWLAVLNLIALSFGLAEYIMGIQSFFPRNVNTYIIYLSRDLLGQKEYRIPSTFTSSAAYSGTMVSTIPLLLGGWAQRRVGWMHSYLFPAALIATGVGVFLGASRTHAAILIMVLLAAILMRNLSAKVLIRSAIIIGCVGWIVANNPRLQRFTTLEDTNFVESRIGTSVNESFWKAVIEYPMGNGLGGGGTSIPYFLQDRLKNPIGIENEYGLIVLEEGIPGLIIWITFLVWSVSCPLPKDKGGEGLGLRLARAYIAISFGAAVLGTGILTAIPETPLLFAYFGWITTARFAATAQAANRARISPSRFAMN